MRAKRITVPITHVNDAITKIASGDFEVRIQNDKKVNDRYSYENELDELTHNLNKMVTEITGHGLYEKRFYEQCIS